MSLYVVIKKLNEFMVYIYSYLYNIFFMGFCFFMVYGFWGRLDMFFFLFVDVILYGCFIKVFNNGNMFCDFIYIDDIVEGVLRVVDFILEGN